MKGLLLMTTDIFNQKNIELNTLFLNCETGAIEKLKGYQLFPSKLNSLKPEEVPLLEIVLDNKGSILLDIFLRPGKHHKNLT